MNPRVEVSLVLMVLQLVVSQLVMSIDEQKMLGQFLRLNPPRFAGAPNEDVFEFLTSCKEKLYNFSLVELLSVDYTTFQGIQTVVERLYRF